MSDTPEKPDADLDLESIFLPAWARSPEQNRYAHFEGERAPSRDDRRGGRPFMRRHDGPRRDGPSREGQRRPGAQGPQDRPGDRQGRDRRGADRRGGDRRGGPPPPPPLELNIAYVPEEKGVDSLTRQIRMTGRAYPLFDIAQLILSKPERYTVTVSTKKKADGGVAQPLFLCAIDDTLWLSEDEAVEWALQKHFDLFYQADKTKIDPPKGTYTFVAQCGMSGVVLGPPNYHDYQNRLRKLHQDRFSRMPFEAYKSRVKIVRDEAVVKQWLEDLSWKIEYVALNMPEPVRLASREEVEKHFRETHLPNIIKSVETHRLNGAAARNIRSPALSRVVRYGLEDQRRFPLQVATVLSQQFASRGLQFFKVNKTVTHVSVSRPHHLDLEAVPVSEGIRKIVDYITAHPRCTRRDVIECLAPSPAPAPPAAPVPPPSTEGTPAEGPAAAAPVAPPAPEPTPQQTAIIADLHWLIHQGHVIEFATGHLETAKKPVVKPPKPAPTPAAEAPSKTANKVEAPGTDASSTMPAVAASEETSQSSESSPQEAPSTSTAPAFGAETRTELEVSASGEAEAIEPNAAHNT